MIRKKFLLSLLALIILPNAFAKLEFKFNASEHPYELRALLESFQIRPLFEIEEREIEALINEINGSIVLIPKAESFFLIKGEMYKSILDYPIAFKGSGKKLDWNAYQLAKRKYQLNAKKLGPFFNWLINAMLSDLSKYEEKDVLKNYLKDRQDGTPSNETEQKLKRRVKFLTPWILQMASSDLQEWERKMTPVMIDILRKINTVTQAVAIASPSKEMRNSAIIEISHVEAKASLAKPTNADEEVESNLENSTEKIVQPDSGPTKELDRLFDTVEEETITATKVREWTPKE